MPNTIVLKPSYTAPYKFSRSFDLGNLSKSASDQGYAYPFALSQLPSYSEFANLFDKYRITTVDLTFSYWFQAEQPSVPGGTTLATVWPAAYFYMDDDDAAIPTVKSEVLERMSLQRASFAPTRQTISVTIKPRWTQNRAGTSSNLAPVGSWIDMATPSVQHYGVKAWIDHYNTGSTAIISLSGVMHFECNNVR
jgi:hypothetical protein